MLFHFDMNLLPGLLPYTKLIDQESFAALIRPKIYQTLSQRIHSVPALKKVEKHWIIFQAITALYNLHDKTFYHGNLNTNNLLLTSWNHLYLADFAWYAPHYILEEKLDDKNYYYPSSSFKCNLAPEKFVSKENKDAFMKEKSQIEPDITKLNEDTIRAL